MYSLISFILLTISTARAFTQGECIKHDFALIRLASQLSPGAAISCRHSLLQEYNANRYWGEQYSKNATVVVFPLTADDVSHTVQAASSSRLGWDLAFVGGGHGQTNASSTSGFLIDLSWMNSTKVLHDVRLGDVRIPNAISYQGGATWKQVTDVTSNTGLAAVGARVGDVGVGGFSTGGGIGFLAGAYGYAIDRIRAFEVVLLSGKIVVATKTNKYSDLFWALQGGGGQFGIVTTFYQEAVPEPTSSEFGIWIIARDSWEQARQNTVHFFHSNNDPFSLMYYSLGYYPQHLLTGNLTTTMVIVGIRFADPRGQSASTVDAYGDRPRQPAEQMTFNATFNGLLQGLDIEQASIYNVPYGVATELSTPFFPYGYRRGFWGPQTSKVSASYLAATSDGMEAYINQSLARGEVPTSAVWVLQYMYPNQNGHGPASDSDTAWPHAQTAHQTLFSPAWRSAVDDGFVIQHNDALNKITHDHQASVGPFIADYPNYISPKADGYRVWGGNVERLTAIKAKYDPECRIHQGRVFASEACIANGWANIYPPKS
ncbi:FAD-binding domain-containing protein [Aureobasidium namibiae CBS 147.97]|uniref:FAD-binding domain-containing protein n=1 Tax=Aureobasidium namibiae CBS 147.97 TaxID=1043004 RepID=A0A074XK14_9PEZI